ncbi:uncharacterized protein LY89DRAFT_665153 [Mollisia scopiformis]|uniref:Uncharacterized protein n=1 Tax=Mollisia scopiformis TaxID=149040 RepID=A0A194XP95_MOLSC|nr:uncharacterized protein LY89DRAFT_665153 [Mollisia scopiformis]KUJ22008.1 hypothetical protein LY89DRAFT_665153 [Mollisia scopiformis]
MHEGTDTYRSRTFEITAQISTRSAPATPRAFNSQRQACAISSTLSTSGSPEWDFLPFDQILWQQLLFAFKSTPSNRQFRLGPLHPVSAPESQRTYTPSETTPPTFASERTTPHSPSRRPEAKAALSDPGDEKPSTPPCTSALEERHFQRRHSPDPCR